MLELDIGESRVNNTWSWNEEQFLRAESLVVGDKLRIRSVKELIAAWNSGLEKGDGAYWDTDDPTDHEFMLEHTCHGLDFGAELTVASIKSIVVGQVWADGTKTPEDYFEVTFEQDNKAYWLYHW